MYSLTRLEQSSLHSHADMPESGAFFQGFGPEKLLKCPSGYKIKLWPAWGTGNKFLFNVMGRIVKMECKILPSEYIDLIN